MEPSDKRLDIELFKRGLVRSRSSAADYINRGKVSVNNVVVKKASTKISDSDDIKISDISKFVSRAGDKLESALIEWKIGVKDLIVIDIGSSTGGFTDCLIQRGAKKVIAVDVGKDQLAKELRDNSEINKKIELYENTDIRKFSLATSKSQNNIPAVIDMAVVDVSFISLTHILSKIFELIKPKGKVICLVKPQFEVGRELAQKRKGIIKDDKERLATLENIKNKSREIGFKVISYMDSPVEGENGNREFLLLLEKCA